MADRLKGITLEIGGDTTKLSKSLSGVNKDIKDTKSQLKDVERLLKLDPTNTELLRQKQKLLKQSVEETSQKLSTLKTASEQAAQTADKYDAWKAAYDPIQKEIESTNKSLIKLKAQQKEMEDCGEVDTDAYKQLSAQVEESNKKLRDLRNQAKAVSDEFENPISPEAYDSLQREIISTENELGNLETASSKANATLSQIGATADKVAAGADKVAKATKGLSAAAAGALAGIGGMAYSAVTSADDLNTLAKQSGFTTAELQKMQYAQDLIDTSMEDITSSAQKLKKNMGSSSDSVTSAFQQLGVSVRDSNGEMRSSTDVYWDVITALSKVGNETERDQLAMTLLGKGADSLAGIIDDGGAAFRALGQEAEEAGLILSQDTLDGLNAVNDKIDSTKAKMQATMATSGAKAMDALMPVFEQVIAAIGKVLDAIGNMDEGQIKLIVSILAVVAAISPVASIVSKISSGVSFLSGTVLPGLSTAAGAVSGGIGSAMSFVTGTVLPGLSSAFSTVFGFIAANPIVLLIAAVVGAVAVIAAKGDEIQAKLGEVNDYAQTVFAKDWTETMGPVLGTAMNGLMDTVKGVWDSIMDVLNGVIDLIRGVFTGDWERAWNGVVEIFRGVFGGIMEAAKAPINGVIGFINTAIAAINEFRDSINSVTEKFGFSIGEIQQLPMLAAGGTVYSGSAIVGEAGPELLTVAGGRAQVTPLTATVDGGSLATALGSQRTVTSVNVQFTGSLSQLAAVLQPHIVAETNRIGGSFTR